MNKKNINYLTPVEFHTLAAMCIIPNAISMHAYTKFNFCAIEIMEACGFALVARLGKGVASLLSTLPRQAGVAILAFR